MFTNVRCIFKTTYTHTHIKARCFEISNTFGLGVYLIMVYKVHRSR